MLKTLSLAAAFGLLMSLSNAATSNAAQMPQLDNAAAGQSSRALEVRYRGRGFRRGGFRGYGFRRRGFGGYRSYGGYRGYGSRLSGRRYYGGYRSYHSYRPYYGYGYGRRYGYDW